MKRKKPIRRRRRRIAISPPAKFALMLKLQQHLVSLQDPNVILARRPVRQDASMKLICSKLSGLAVSSSQQHNEKAPLVPLFPPVSQSVAAIIFGDGSSESRRQLYPLTKRRSEGAIPMAANYRLIDAVVSNCINSNITKIYALTQFNSTSLNSHLSKAYSRVGLGKDGFVEVLAAYQSPENQEWFQGNADAVRRCLWVLEEYLVDEFLILPGHHLYKMDYQKLVEAHRKADSAITIVVLSADQARARKQGFGILKFDSENRVNEINCKEAESFGKTEDVGCIALPSTGIYLIRRDVMIKLLKECFPDANEIGEEVIRGAISLGMKVQSYLFDGHWEDMKSIGAFYRANMENTQKSTARFNFYDRGSPVYTLPRCLPPSIVSDSIITNSIIGDGCILNSCKIKGSVIGMRTRVEDGATVEDSVIMGSDIYEDVQRSSFNGKPCSGDVEGNSIKGKLCTAVPPIGIGANTHIQKSIVDKNARIGKNVRIINRDDVQEGDREAEGYMIKEGIVVVLRGAVIPDSSIL